MHNVHVQYNYLPSQNMILLEVPPLDLDEQSYKITCITN